MLKKIYHNRNELQEVEFFEDKECTQAFDFTNAKSLKYRLCIFNKQLSPWADIYDYNNQLIDQFRPSKSDIETINNANKFMQKNGLPLFDISQHYVQDKHNQYYYTYQYTNAKNLYIDGLNGDITPLLALDRICPDNRHSPIITLYTPYLIKNCRVITNNLRFKTLNDITPNLSKYIPEDNAVLFLDGEKISLCDYDEYYNMFSGYRDIEFEGKIIKGMPYHPQIYGIHTIGDRVSVHKHEYDIDDYTNFTLNILKNKKLTIFLHHGTQSELQKAEEVGKYLWENFKIKPNLCVLHCFIKYDVLHYEILNIDESGYFSKTPEEAFEYIQNTLDCDDDGFVEKYTKEYDDEFRKDFEEKKALFFKSLPFNKIITTNSTGVLKPEDSNERLQVIDCFDIFQDHLNNI